MHKDLSSLKHITSAISQDLILFKEEFDKALKSDVTLINTISKYMIRNRGKNIRPILTILSARMCGEPSQNTYRAAAMMELLHVATLIHDDVVDDATMRRGKPSLNRVWKNKISILMGDFILSKALINMVGIRDFDALEKISNTAEKLSAGEILQLEKSITRSMTEDVYFDMISQKTASLIATSCELGAITTKKTDENRKATHDFGENLGMAFQIKDDLFDIVGSEYDTGKDSGSDVKKNMMTLPLIYSSTHMDRSNKRKLKKLLNVKKKNKSVLKDIQILIEQTGGIDYANKKLDEYSNRALDALSIYPESEYKMSLVNLVSFNKSRVK
ncbi:MAG: polyprenyl synthetase family protein [Fidelibacterota bacterium]|jgi:octaprenyl-diphosphate synthase|tara:strand:- start:1313 stop:2302 length:990 start_codon:yes stop_codon:yes gene_type:complete